MVEDGQEIDLNLRSVAIDTHGNMIAAETIGPEKKVNSNKSLSQISDIPEGGLGTIIDCSLDGGGLGEGGFGKVIDCNLISLPISVSELYFIVTVDTPDKSFDDLKAASVRVIDKGAFRSATSNMTLCKFTPGRGEEHTTMHLMRFSREGMKWHMSIIDGMTSGKGFGTLITEIKEFSLLLNKT